MGKVKPFDQQAKAYQGEFDYFNRQLFDGKLSAVMLNFSRKARSRGFYVPGLWSRGRAKAAEITLNPETMGRVPVEYMSTLVHEMVHHWQFSVGKPGRRGYHNAEWAEKMEEVGLIPTATGERGGARVGQSMSHLVEKGGPFEVAFERMPPSLLLPWIAVALGDGKKKKRSNTRLKFACGTCGAAAWGKPDLHLRCDDCDEVMEGDQ